MSLLDEVCSQDSSTEAGASGLGLSPAPTPTLPAGLFCEQGCEAQSQEDSGVISHLWDITGQR